MASGTLRLTPSIDISPRPQWRGFLLKAQKHIKYMLMLFYDVQKKASLEYQQRNDRKLSGGTGIDPVVFRWPQDAFQHSRR